MFKPIFCQALAVSLLSSLMAPLGAMAQDWPNKPIRMVIDRLNSEINRILVTPAVTQIIRGLGAEPTPMSPAQLTALNAADTSRFANIIKQQGIRAE